MINPRVTVLMPVYNGALYLREAIDSILNQTYTDFEFLIINDGSTDASEAIISSYSDTRIRLINQNNAGVSAALNNGIQLAKGAYIARMDADDRCMSTRLEEQMNFLDLHPEYVMIGSDADYMDKDGFFVFHYSNTGHSNEEINERVDWITCPFIHSAVIYKKEGVIAAGAYDENAYLFEDHFLWIKLIKLGKVANLKKALISVRLNPSSVTIDQRDCSAEYLNIKNKAIQTGLLNDEEGAILRKNVIKISATQKLYSYHAYLGKKYLWNNYHAANARTHFLEAIKVYPLKVKTYLLLLMSFLPASMIKMIYQKVKSMSAA
jgi:glycosyltransferase involved in cell wall biosynthesis